MLPSLTLKKTRITGLVLDETKTYDVDHDATIVEEDGTEVRIAREMFSIRMPAFGTVDHQLCGSYEQLYPQYCRLLTLAFMRGGAIDYYSNNVQVAPMGAG